jgi:hypothetical protein
MSNGTVLLSLDRNKLYGGLRGLEPFYASLQNLRPAEKNHSFFFILYDRVGKKCTDCRV